MSDTWITYNGVALTLNGYALVKHNDSMPAKTVRFRFEDPSYDPTQVSGWKTGATWTQVSSSPNVWDYYRDNRYWTNEFKDKFTTGSYYVHVVDGDLTGVISVSDYVYGGLFEGNTRLRTVALHGLQDVITSTASSDKKGIERAFWGCSSLTNCSLSGFTGCTQYLFMNCSSLETVSLTDFYPTYATMMFKGCSSLVTAPSFDGRYINEAGGMFTECTSLTTVPAYNFGSSLTKMGSMFKQCSSLTSVPVFNTASVTDMQSIFYASGIQATPAWDTGNVANFSQAFALCTSLSSIGSLATGNATNVQYMFSFARNVAGGALALYTQMSTQFIPPATHDDCFNACGSNTPTGSQELAQIPTSWGGTMA